MSKAVRKAFRVPTRTHAAKLVLLKLAAHMDRRGLAWPSTVEVARACGLSERHVRRILAELAEAGLIERWGVRGKRRKVWRLVCVVEGEEGGDFADIAMSANADIQMSDKKTQKASLRRRLRVSAAARSAGRAWAAADIRNEAEGLRIWEEMQRKYPKDRRRAEEATFAECARLAGVAEADIFE